MGRPFNHTKKVVANKIRCKKLPDTLAMPSIVKATKAVVIHIWISALIILTIALPLPSSAQISTTQASPPYKKVAAVADNPQPLLGAVTNNWVPNKRLTLMAKVTMSDVDEAILYRNKNYHLTCLTQLYGVNLRTRLYKADDGFLSRLAYPLVQTYMEDTSGYSLEAASTLGQLQVRAGIGEIQNLNGLVTHTRQIGADYGFTLYGAQWQTAVELKNEIGSTNSTTLTRKLTADLPLTDEAKLQARVELVDIDHLRDLAAHSDAIDQETIAKLGVAGSLALGKAGALQIGYEMVHNMGADIQALSSSAEAGIEYNLNPQAKLKAGVNYDFNESGTRSVTDVNLGYDLTKDTNLMAGYKLINFNDMASGDFQANVAQARLSVKF